MIKTVGTAHYVHHSNVNELASKYIPTITEHKNLYLLMFWMCDKHYDFDVIKYDKGNLTFISSPDWDTANEPIVGTCYRWKANNWIVNDEVIPPKITQNYKQIYHNKWQFVANDYKGFDIEQAKYRSKVWNSLADIKSVKNKIGYKSFWVEYLTKNGLTL